MVCVLEGVFVEVESLGLFWGMGGGGSGRAEGRIVAGGGRIGGVEGIGGKGCCGRGKGGIQLAEVGAVLAFDSRGLENKNYD